MVTEGIRRSGDGRQEKGVVIEDTKRVVTGDRRRRGDGRQRVAQKGDSSRALHNPKLVMSIQPKEDPAPFYFRFMQPTVHE